MGLSGGKVESSTGGVTMLQDLAHNYLTRERSDHTLQTTALVHEAYLKLINQRSVNWQNRTI